MDDYTTNEPYMVLQESEDSLSIPIQVVSDSSESLETHANETNSNEEMRNLFERAGIEGTEITEIIASLEVEEVSVTDLVDIPDDELDECLDSFTNNVESQIKIRQIIKTCRELYAFLLSNIPNQTKSKMYALKFATEGMTVAKLKDATLDDLKGLGINLGDRLKIRRLAKPTVALSQAYGTEQGSMVLWESTQSLCSAHEAVLENGGSIESLNTDMNRDIEDVELQNFVERADIESTEAKRISVLLRAEGMSVADLITLKNDSIEKCLIKVIKQVVVLKKISEIIQLYREWNSLFKLIGIPDAKRLKYAMQFAHQRITRELVRDIERDHLISLEVDDLIDRKKIKRIAKISTILHVTCVNSIKASDIQKILKEYKDCLKENDRKLLQHVISLTIKERSAMSNADVHVQGENIHVIFTAGCGGNQFSVTLKKGVPVHKCTTRDWTNTIRNIGIGAAIGAILFALAGGVLGFVVGCVGGPSGAAAGAVTGAMSGAKIGCILGSVAGGATIGAIIGVTFVGGGMGILGKIRKRDSEKHICI